MSSRFVRSIRDIINVDKQSLNTTQQNDIVSDKTGQVYVRTLNEYVRITGLKEINNDLIELQQQVDILEPDSEKVKETLKQLKEQLNNIDHVDITAREDIATINTTIEKIQSNFNNIEHVDETARQDIEGLKTNTSSNETNIGKNTTDINTLKSDVSTLQQVDEEQNTKIQLNQENLSEINISDSGWQDLPLNEGVEPYSDPPQFKEVNVNDTQTISLRGSVKGLDGTKTTISVLPLEKELTNPHYFVQNSSGKTDADGNSLVPFVRWTVQRDGSIVYNAINIDNSLLDGTEWNPINTQFEN